MTISQAQATGNPGQNKRAAVAMSGGVDSSVSAALLQQQGYEVVGYFMKNWTDVAEAAYRDGECPWLEDYQDAQKVAAHLGIELRLVNLEREYRDKVFDYFIAEYKAGRTPNPDVMCNTEIKFRSFMQIAIDDGFEVLATGHYASLRSQNFAGQAQYELLRGIDPNKDQSYFIHHLSQEQLRYLQFPIGHLQKPKVRELAHEFNLPVASKKDSQGLCFVGEIDFPTFLETYIPHTPGPMITVDGEAKGEHRGLEFYTIGQRYGLEIGGDGPYFVVEKRLEDNTLIICKALESGEDHPALLSNWFEIEEPFWVSGNAPTSGSAQEFSCTVKVRYRSPDVACTVNGNRVELALPERAITTGQFAVFYNGDVVLGGAVINNRELNI